MRYIHELVNEIGARAMVLDGCPVHLKRKNSVNILALGDVGTTMLIGLRLLGADVISCIGICDIKPGNTERLEMEINQIGYPFENDLPPVKIVQEENLFDCDVMIFCASKGVPPVGEKTEGMDVRMAQLEANRDLIRHYATLAGKGAYTGLVCIVSDPVDPLAAAFLDASGLMPWQIQGYGLGVMNTRARYYAEKADDAALHKYKQEGRAFGPHGQDLVIANSIDNYDETASKKLTDMTVNANLKVRELGYKPYIAPALSSAALSILLTLRGQWHYGSVYLGSKDRGAYLGVRNRLKPSGWEYEDAPLPDELYQRIRKAFLNLCEIR